jgi:DNA (cytosine-5)-methyltransferase 1
VAPIPFIDIFAGPGGLSEGFSRFSGFSGNETAFESRLAIEKEEVAARTLELRSFFRAFPEGEVPDDYYQVIRGKRSLASLALHPQWEQAEAHVWNATLGDLPEEILHRRIRQALAGNRDWVLLGGPPCQAYSLMGRARSTGIGAAARAADKNLDELRRQKWSKFAADHKHLLYREYLRIVAVHQPAVFVMENVKGILSSRLQTPDGKDKGRVFEQIRNDLSDPSAALAKDPEKDLLDSLKTERTHQYRLFSFVASNELSGGEVRDADFLIRSEEYGIPQKRHRVILLGVRDDVLARPQSLLPLPQVTVRNTIETLPALRSGVSKGDSDWASWVRTIRESFRSHGCALPGDQAAQDIICEFLSAETKVLHRGAPFLEGPIEDLETSLGIWYHDARLNGVIQHEARSHMASDLPRYLYAAAQAQVSGYSPKLEDWPRQLLPSHRNVRYDEKADRVIADGFNDRFKVQVWDEPSSTVTSHIAKDGHYFIHPDPLQCRSLTVREAARLQTFPDNYYFCGNRTQQYHQVGNAVPPYLAYQIAGVVARLFQNTGPVD